MKNSVECRFATIDDVEEIFAIDNSLFDKDKYSKQTFLDSIKNDIQKLVVAYDEQKIVGYILFSYILEEAELLKIGVMSKNQ